MRNVRRPIGADALSVLFAGLVLGSAPALAARMYDSVTDRIQASYLAYYGRSADPAGLAYWVGRIQAPGAEARQIVNELGHSVEFETLAQGKTNTQLVTGIYRQLFGRDPDGPGLAFYLGLLDTGAATPQGVAQRILDGAQGGDGDVVDNRIEFSRYYTDRMGRTGGSFDAAANRGILSMVTENDDSVATARGEAYRKLGYHLAILHINDHHSHLEPNAAASLKFNGVTTTVETGGFPRVVAKMSELEATHENVLKLHAGDAITGTIYFSSFKGEPDALLMNLVCFDAFALGNHEFDEGDAGLARFLGFLADPESCSTPVLAANVIPAVGTPLRPDAGTSLIKPYTVETLGGERVAIIGIATANKTAVSSSPLDTTAFLDEATTAQATIDSLSQSGINKFILLSHNGFERDLAILPALRGVDVVINGDSHTLLGKGFSAFGLTPVDSYPTQARDADGNLVCVGQAWQYADIVGEMKLVFDAQGRVIDCGGTPHLLLGDTFKRGNPAVELSGADRGIVLDAIAAAPELSIVTPDPTATTILSTYKAEVEVLKTTVVGQAAGDLCLSRVPGDSRSGATCDPKETQANGGDIQQLVTYAYLERSFRADIAIQNGGGVRIVIPAGAMTIAKAFELLPFANTLVEFDLTGAEVRQVLEEAANNVVANNSTGAYPYGANIRWHMDLSRPMGSRLSNVEIRPKGTAEWVPLQDSDPLVVVTNSFLATGGDGYATFKTAYGQGRYVNTYIDYAQGFIDYMQQNVGGAMPGDPYLTVPPTVSAVRCEDYSTQRFTSTAGVTQLPDPSFPRACESAPAARAVGSGSAFTWVQFPVNFEVQAVP